MFVENCFILVVVPVAQKMVGFFRERDILILLFYRFIASILLFHVELTMKHQYFEARIFIKKNKAILLSREATPNDVVQLEISDIGIIEFLLRVEPKLVLKGNNSHLLPFDLEKLCLQGLLPQLQRILLGDEFEATAREHMVGYGLVCANQQHIWEANAPTHYPGIALDML